MSVEFRSPAVAIIWPLGEVSSDTVTVSIAINSNTTATFSAYSGTEASEGSNSVLATEAATLMGRAQQLGFSRRNSPDTQVDLQDGGGNSLTLNGYLVGPTFMVDTRTLKPGFAMVSGAAPMANLKLDIYRINSPRSKPDDPLAGGVATIEQASVEPNLADRLAGLTRRIISYWEENKKTQQDSASATLREDRHLVNNDGPLGLWYTLLGSSRAQLENEWLPLLSKKEDANCAFNRDVLSILRGVSRDFQGVLEELMSTFQLVHVPGIDGGPGHLDSMPRLLSADPVDLKLPASSVLLNGKSSHDLFPVQQVLVVGTPTSAVQSALEYQTQSEVEGGFLIGGFPPERAAAAGDSMMIPLPPFLSKTVDAFVVGEPKGNNPPNVGSLKNQRLRVQDIARKFGNEISDKIVEEYSKSVYIDTALGGLSTSIDLPAQLDLWPGTRYRVLNAAGGELFVGFLAGVTHSFSKGGGSGNATTTCNFTHILFPGFTLPGIE